MTVADNELREGDVILWNYDPCTVVGFRADGMLVEVSRHGDGQVLCLPRNPASGPLWIVCPCCGNKVHPDKFKREAAI